MDQLSAAVVVEQKANITTVNPPQRPGLVGSEQTLLETLAYCLIVTLEDIYGEHVSNDRTEPQPLARSRLQPQRCGSQLWAN
jgi:hypothetical protein